MILLDIPEADDLYVIVDQDGDVFYLDAELKRGWPDEYEAEREARSLESRGEGRFQVVRQGQMVRS